MEAIKRAQISCKLALISMGSSTTLVIAFNLLNFRNLRRLYVSAAISTCLFAPCIPLVLTLRMLVKLISVPSTGSTVFDLILLTRLA